MASNGTGQRPGDSSFLQYQVGQRAKSGRGLQQIDNAIGTPMPNANAGAGVQKTPDSVMPPPAAVPAASSPPLTLNGPEMVETQPGPLRLLDQDRYYRDNGHLPTAADLAAGAFAKTFQATQGRAPTKDEVVAHLYRRPDQIPQASQDFTTGG
jgi:hypothetical protein